MSRSIEIPELSLVVLIGASGAGKSTLAARLFRPTEVLSSDRCRGMVADDENDQTVSQQAFELLHYIAAKRLALGRLAVVDATNVKREDRKPLVALARRYHCQPVAIVLDVDPKTCQARNRARADRQFGEHVVRQHHRQLRRSRKGLKREGFRYVHWLNGAEEIDSVEMVRCPMWTDQRRQQGPFDIIGDVHGCADELHDLLAELGYQPPAPAAEPAADQEAAQPIRAWHHPADRRAVFLGDLVDRGPKSDKVLAIVMDMVDAGSALCTLGNHDDKLKRKLQGRKVRISHGLAETLEQIDARPPEFSERVQRFLQERISHYVLDGGALVVAHAGMRAEMAGRGSGAVRQFALYGDTTGETDAFGLPVRHPWAEEYRGRAWVVYGHTPVPEPEWLNKTVNIDTGCVFGGALTALRYPEREIVAVPARHTYYEPARPFLDQQDQAPALTAQQRMDEVLDLADVTGRRIIHPRLFHAVTIREDYARAALEIMARFAVNPKWLIYMPPTMSPCETSKRPGLLEHPEEAFDHYRSRGVGQVVCQEKHMGSRAVVIACRDADAARQAFGVDEPAAGVCYTRTGRPFFKDAALERDLVARVRRAMDETRTWEALDSDWVCLDCELMPWSLKSQELLRSQYAAVGSAARHALPQVIETLQAAADRELPVGELLDAHRERAQMTERYIEAYRRYCWRVAGPEDLRLAPFHVMASRGRVHLDRDHRWHLDTIRRLCQTDDPVLLATVDCQVDVTDPDSRQAAVEWWQELTAGGGEGMVVKPLPFIARNRRGLLQPAVKCRGREYLRIIYGPEYTTQANLDRLRARGLHKKRSLAIREFALGIEALERFVRKEPLRRIHECTFAVLALETEPVDPRL